MKEKKTCVYTSIHRINNKILYIQLICHARIRIYNINRVLDRQVECKSSVHSIARCMFSMSERKREEMLISSKKKNSKRREFATWFIIVMFCMDGKIYMLICILISAHPTVSWWLGHGKWFEKHETEYVYIKCTYIHVALCRPLLLLLSCIPHWKTKSSRWQSRNERQRATTKKGINDKTK